MCNNFLIGPLVIFQEMPVDDHAAARHSSESICPTSRTSPPPSGRPSEWSGAEAGVVAVTLSCSETDGSAAAAVDPTDPVLDEEPPLTRSGVSFFMDEISLGGGLSDLIGLGELGDEAQGSDPIPIPPNSDANHETAPCSSDAAERATLGKPRARAHSQSEFALNARVELAEAQDLAEACRPDPASPTAPPATRSQKRARLGLSRASSQPREWWEHYLLNTS